MAVAGRPEVVEGLRLVRLVGRGGEGEVWDARDTAGLRRAAKLILPEALATPEEVAERSVYLRRIDHPALVRVHRSGIVEDGPLAGWGFVEMDFVDGESLQRAPADPDVVHRLEGLAEALDLLHIGVWSDGVPLVHRDVKPANLIATANGQVVLVDASTLRGVDATQLTRIGTPVFSAPEVLTGRIGPAADVYSFAVTVVALVTGARGARLAELVDRVDRLDLPEGVALALSPAPGDRPASCRSILEPAAAIPADLEPRESGLLEPERPGTEHPGTERLEPHHPDERAGDWLPPARFEVPPPPPAPHDRERAVPAREEWAVPAREEWTVPAREEWADDDGDVAERWHPEPPPRVPEPPPEPRARPVWPWVAVLAGLVVVSGLAWSIGELPRDQLVAGAAGAYGIHLVAHVATRRPLALAILLPPLAWAFLLADRAAGPRRLRRGWARALLTGALAVVTLPPVAVLVEQFPDLDRLEAVSLSVVGLLLVTVAVWAAGAGGAGGLAARILLLPVWAAGAVVLAAGAVLLLPLAALTGRGGAALRLAGGAVAGVAETFRSPRGRGVHVPPGGAAPGYARYR